MSTLPPPQFIDTDPLAVEQRLISRIEARLGRKLQPAHSETLLAKEIAYELSLHRLAVNDAARLNLLDFSRYPMTDYLGALVDAERLEEQPAATSLRFTLSAAQSFNVLVPLGTRVMSQDGQHIFRTAAPLVIVAGNLTGDVTAMATTAGASANGYIPGEVSELLDPVAYVTGARNVSETSGGAERESDPAYIERIKFAPERFSNAGPRGAYRFFARTADVTIVDVSVITDQDTAEVYVYPLTVTGLPSDEVREKVLAVLDDEAVRPATDRVFVEPPQEVPFSVVVDVTLYADADAGQVQAACEAAMNTYQQRLRSSLGVDVVIEQIVTILGSVSGVYRPDVTLFDANGQPWAGGAVARSQWAHLTGYTLNLVGVVDG